MQRNGALEASVIASVEPVAASSGAAGSPPPPPEERWLKVVNFPEHAKPKVT